MRFTLRASLVALLLVLGGCALSKLPLSTSDDVAGYSDLVARYAADPEAAARFDIFEAQADGLQALSLLEQAVVHPDLPAGAKPRLKSLAAALTAALADYTAMITACPDKTAAGACPGFEARNARVLAYRNILESVRRELLRLAGQGLLALR